MDAYLGDDIIERMTVTVNAVFASPAELPVQIPIFLEMHTQIVRLAVHWALPRTSYAR